MTRNRIASEARRIDEQGVSLKARTPFEWYGTVHGKGKWRLQQFPIQVTLPENYPLRPPLVRFLKQPVPKHPNISPTGYVCLNLILNAWNPRMNLVTVMDLLEWLFENPNYGLGFVPDSYVRSFHPNTHDVPPELQRIMDRLIRRADVRRSET